MSDVNQEADVLTESVCPVCLRRIPALITERGVEMVMGKECPDHGRFETPVWRGIPSMESWRRPKPLARPKACYTEVVSGCPFDCGLCADHEQLPCSVLLEVTQRCNLRCPLCFADAGLGPAADPDLETLKDWYRRAMETAGPCNIQLSGGEPTLRDDLPAIVEAGRAAGFDFIQVNTNGLRLARDATLARTLKSAGLATVFLQFDGVDDGPYIALRGRPLFEEKRAAIGHCAEAGLGVVLVPAIVPGVNDESIGAIVKFALAAGPHVRGVHFQPVSYFGRHPGGEGKPAHMTLPEVMRALGEQTGGLVPMGQLMPPGCEHELCSFHGSFIRMDDGTLKPVTGKAGGGCCSGSADRGVTRTVSLVASQWGPPETGVPWDGPHTLPGGLAPMAPPPSGLMDLDTFLEQARTRSFTISCMAFQDGWNLDLRRLRKCCISVVAPDGRLVPFCAYNLTGTTGERLYRSGPRGS